MDRSLTVAMSIEPTTHRLEVGDARDQRSIPDGSVHLVVTSPPYPMIEMWDATFRLFSDDIARALDDDDGAAGFAAMHRELDRVWKECHRVLAPGGIACINIGDATRTLRGEFQLFPNHARVISGMVDAGFSVLPDVIWRKPTNSPTKFLGSGMLPGGAYVTYEHEYLLHFRKGGRRVFSEPDRHRRRASAYFWEERNMWFSDVWDTVRGTGQDQDLGSRQRNAAYPPEIPYRLILMHSLLGDSVLDPFAGTGTTTMTAAAAGRSSIGIEWDAEVIRSAAATVAAARKWGAQRTARRYADHLTFVAARTSEGKPPRHQHGRGFPVVTAQETALELPGELRMSRPSPTVWSVAYDPFVYEDPRGGIGRQPTLPWDEPGG